ncbi:hypothetical protein [Nonomuraea longicatena]|uniref:CU044_5270 family protein n=1 Tax=Nonomuraea longicatena TaxID=83682 RepID=A0ABN1Q6A5_9ACTN
MEELQELRRYHDTLPEAAPESVGAARSRLAGHMRTSRSPRLRRIRPMWGLSLAGAAAALLAAALIVVPDVTRETSDVTRDKGVEAPQARPSAAVTKLRLRPVANARDLADNAAVLASDEPEWRAEPTQWSYVKSLSARTQVNGGERLHGRPTTTNTQEQWRRLNDKAFAFFEKGKLEILKGSEFEVAYAYLLALPTDADRLLARIYETVDTEDAKRRAASRQRAEGMGETPQDEPALTSVERDRWAFQLIATGMRDAALPPRLRAAMYGALAGIPGVRYEAKSSDLLKRRGVTLYHVLDGYLRDEVFINPKTYEYLGYRVIVLRDKDERFNTMKKGEILNWDAVVEATVVDKAGQRPG